MRLSRVSSHAGAATAGRAGVKKKQMPPRIAASTGARLDRMRAIFTPAVSRRQVPDLRDGCGCPPHHGAALENQRFALTPPIVGRRTFALHLI